MAQRLIRDGLLGSERVQGLPAEGRWLFVAMMLMADDLGLLELNSFKVCREANLNDKVVEKLLGMMVDVDLIRVYEKQGKRWAYIPKFGQRLQIKRAKCPLPPMELLQGDEDTIKKIKHLTGDPTVTHGDSRKSTVSHRNPPPEPEPEPEEEPKVEVGEGGVGETMRPALTLAPAPAARRPPAKPSVPACPYDAIIDLYHEVLPELPRVLMREGSKGWPKRAKAIRTVWEWTLTSKLSTGERRATNPQEAVAWFRKFFERASENDFIMGRTPRSREHAGWKADLDYLLSERGMKQVVERT